MSDGKSRARIGPAALRKLGATEDMYWRFDSECPLYFGVLARFAGAYDEARFREALRAVQARHPLLRARILVEAGKPWFVETDREIPVETLEQAPGEEWQVLERSLVERFDTELGPLLRCTVMKHAKDDVTILFTFHHAVSDGRSAIFVIRDLLQSLAQQERGQSAALLPLELMDYYGDRIHTLRSYESWRQFGATVSRTWKASWRFVSNVGLPKGIEKRSVIPSTEPKFMVEPRFIEADTMTKLIKRAKSEQVTIQCVLNAALSMAVAEDSPTQGIEATTCTQVLDVRDRLFPPVGEDCGLFVSGNTSMHRIREDTRFWDLARDIRVGLQASLDTPLPFFHPATHVSYARIARVLGNERASQFSKALGRIHPEGLCVSNLGRVKLEVPGSPLRLTAFAFATNTSILNYFNTSAASCEGRMSWSFSASSAVGREKLRKIADRSIALILEALES